MSKNEVVVIKLPKVRLSFPRLFVPKAFSPAQEPRFEATFLLDPSNKAHAGVIAQIKSEAKRVATEKWGANLPKALKKCYGLADESGKEYDGYAGMFYIASANKTRPRVVGPDRVDLVESDGKPYAGCFVNATVSLWAWGPNVGGHGLNANLRGVQFVEDGDAFGVRPVDAEEEFDALEETATAGGDDWDA